MEADILLACTDLFFASRIENTAKQLGAKTHRLGSEELLPTGRLLIVDMDCKQPEPIALIERAREQQGNLPIVAFIRHDEVEGIRAARAAGASQVLARGAFTERLPKLVQGALTVS